MASFKNFIKKSQRSQRLCKAHPVDKPQTDALMHYGGLPPPLSMSPAWNSTQIWMKLIPNRNIDGGRGGVPLPIATYYCSIEKVAMGNITCITVNRYQSL